MRLPTSPSLDQRTLHQSNTHSPHADDRDHAHADSVTVTSDGCVDPAALFELLEPPPAGAYRLKGVVAVRYRATVRHYVVNLGGTSIHVAGAPPTATTGIPNHLVAIGVHLDSDEVRTRMSTALQSRAELPSARGIRRLQQYRRLSI